MKQLDRNRSKLYYKLLNEIEDIDLETKASKRR